MKITLNADGSAVASNADEGRLNKDGSPAVDTWSMGAGQLGPHLRGVERELAKGDKERHPFAGASKGDLSAARDAAAEFAKREAAVLKDS
jgi:hypothetical protein